MNTLSIKSMSNQISKKKKKGFTLVELIIVIAIIAILAAIAIPKMGTVKHNANIKADIANAKNIHTAAAGAVVDEQIKTGNYTLGDSKAKPIEDRLDAFSTTAKTDSSKFNVEVKANGDIVVKAGTSEVYPEQEGDFKIDKTTSNNTGGTGTES